MNYREFVDEVSTHALPVVVDFWAPWCGPCKVMQPILNQVSGAYLGKIDLMSVNVDENPDIAKTMNIMAIPTLVAFVSGKVVYRKAGLMSRINLETIFYDLVQGKTPNPFSISLFNRLLRLVIGTGILLFGIFQSPSTVLIVLGGLVAFSGVYDRCPIFRAVSNKMKSIFEKPVSN